MSAPRTVKGFADLFEPESGRYTFMENTARRVFAAYGYRELRVPVLEYTELFARSIGTETDIVQKEMFTFPDRKGRSLTMRPEATAGIVRAYIERGLHGRENLSKFFSCGPMFRYERPQKGRMRQFHQLDCECLGASEPEADAEVILMLMLFLREIGLTRLSPEINTLGCRECRPAFRAVLLEFLQGLAPETLCEDCRRRMRANPMRVLDCKVPGCKTATGTAPRIDRHVCPACEGHFAVVRSILERHGIPYTVNPRLVRGLDYYSRTTFEVASDSIGAQGSVAGGGRYDGLVAGLGGPDVPGIGFACGMERLALLMSREESPRATPRPDFYIAALDPETPGPALSLAQELRENGLAGETAFQAKSLKSQMRQASRNNARYCLILGGDELRADAVVVKDMDGGEQTTLPRAGLADWARTVRYEGG